MQVGDKVKFQKELIHKGYSYTTGCVLNHNDIKELDKEGKLSKDLTRYMEHDNKKVLEGIICGIRTIKYKGYSPWIGYEEGYGFVTIEYKRVYLIACNLKEFHRVPEEFLIIMEETGDV